MERIKEIRKYAMKTFTGKEGVIKNGVEIFGKSKELTVNPGITSVTTKSSKTTETHLKLPRVKIFIGKRSRLIKGIIKIFPIVSANDASNNTLRSLLYLIPPIKAEVAQMESA